MGQGQGGNPRGTAVPVRLFAAPGNGEKACSRTYLANLAPLHKIVAGAQQLDILQLILQPLSIAGPLLLQG
jgi:hypothetical protein